jgi:glycosyltransferase involved in cell wall biosynthesis
MPQGLGGTDVDPDPVTTSPTPGATVELSIIVPMYNEAANIDAFFARLVPVLERLGATFEIICVNDGSRDDTFDRLKAKLGTVPGLKLLGLSRNFGKDMALTAGLTRAHGRAAIPIDADLQHPPELIPDLVARWREGTPIVYARRRTRAIESPLKAWLTRVFYWLFARMTGIAIPPDAGDFRLLDRRVYDVMNRMPERARFIKGIYMWVGFNSAAVDYDPAPRERGATGFGFLRLLAFAIDGLTSFSTWPLRIWSQVGLVVSFLSLIYGSFLVIRTLILGIDVPGYASTMVAVLFLGGIQLISLGVIGEYVGRIYAEVKGRPMFIVGEQHGFDDPPR